MSSLNGRANSQDDITSESQIYAEEMKRLIQQQQAPTSAGGLVTPKFPTNSDDFRDKSNSHTLDGHDDLSNSQDLVEINTTAPVTLTMEQICPQIFAAVAVSIASMMVGFSSAYTSPALASMDMPNSTLKVTEEEKSWIGSLMPLSALVGSFIGGYLSEVLGRKSSILICGPPLLVASILMGSAINVWMIYVGRVIIGLCIGVLSLCMPIYLSETIQAEIRGMLTLLPTTIGNAGILVCYLAGSYVNWSVLAYIGGIIPCTFTIMMIFLPESSRWLLLKDKNAAAEKSLRWLRGPSFNIKTEINSITHSRSAATQRSSYIELFNSRYFRPLFISLCLMMFQQFSGINAVIFYSVSIFKHAGSSLDSNLCTVIVGVVNIFSTLIANSLIEKVGRKILLVTSSALIIVSLLSFSTYFYIKEVLTLENDDTEFWLKLVSKLGWLPLVSLMTYITAFSLGWGPLPWLFIGECLPNKIRGPGGSLVAMFNWGSSFIVTKTFPGMVDTIGAYGVFYMFLLIMTVALVFTCIFYPETKGKSLEEIEATLTRPCCNSKQQN